MARKLASIQKIIDIQPIEGADKIEVATVLGWKVVVSKAENHKIGDLVCYVEIDSQCPATPMFEFLKDRKYRVRTIKLRKQVSQGLIIPLSAMPNGKYEEGQDVTKLLGITKYDPEAEVEAKLLNQNTHKNPLHKFLMKYKLYRKLYSKLHTQPKGGFPSWIKKTDETRLQVLTGMFNEVVAKNDTDKPIVFDVTEKLDGQSATYFVKVHRKLGIFRDYEFGVCSRNMRLKIPTDSSYWTIAKQLDMENVLKDIAKKYNADTVVLQGEICGGKIQGNKYKIDDYKLFAFNLIIDGEKYRTFDMDFILGSYGIETVPILVNGIKLKNTIDDMVEFSKGNSEIQSETKREGLVFRNMKNDISFKVINPDFLLKYDE